VSNLLFIASRSLGKYSAIVLVLRR
jgi:hypothetical protein